MKSGNLYSEHPLVSIVTPAYNVEAYLEDTLKSVLSQTYNNWQMLLVVDSHSSDKTLEIAQKFSREDARIQVFHNPHSPRGVAENRNAAIAAAQGELIAFLDSDDLWLPTKLERQVAHIMQRNAKISYHSFTPLLQGQRGKIRRAVKTVTANDLLKDNVLSCISVMASAPLIKQHQFKNTPHEDLVFWLEILKDHQAEPLDDSLAFYRVRSDSRSGNKIHSALWRWQLYRQQGFSLFSSVRYMMFYIFNSLAKRI